MTTLDCVLLLGVVQSGPRPLFATVSGAHLYGFPSPEGDVDLRGALVLPVREVLRCFRTPQAYAWKEAEYRVGITFVRNTRARGSAKGPTASRIASANGDGVAVCPVQRCHDGCV